MLFEAAGKFGGHHFADREAGGGGRAGGVQDVDGGAAQEEVEVLDKRTVGFHGLGADTSARRHDVTLAHFWHQFLQGAAEERGRKGAAEFGGAHGGVLAEEAPKAREGEGSAASRR